MGERRPVLAVLLLGVTIAVGYLVVGSSQQSAQPLTSEVSETDVKSDPNAGGGLLRFNESTAFPDDAIEDRYSANFKFDRNVGGGLLPLNESAAIPDDAVEHRYGAIDARAAAVAEWIRQSRARSWAAIGAEKRPRPVVGDAAFAKTLRELQRVVREGKSVWRQLESISIDATHRADLSRNLSLIKRELRETSRQIGQLVQVRGAVLAWRNRLRRTPEGTERFHAQYRNQNSTREEIASDRGPRGYAGLAAESGALNRAMQFPERFQKDLARALLAFNERRTAKRL